MHYFLTLFQKISLSRRLCSPSFRRCLLAVDGIDCQIQEPPRLVCLGILMKNSAGLRYEVRLSLKGDIVWICGPFKGGDYSDLRIFNACLSNKLGDGEQVIPDHGYKNEHCLQNSYLTMKHCSLHQNLLARHESRSWWSLFHGFCIWGKSGIFPGGKCLVLWSSSLPKEYK